MTSCHTAPTKKKVKKSRTIHIQQLYVLGHDGLDVRLEVTLPKEDAELYRIDLNNLDRSGFHHWKDTSWAALKLDTCLHQLVHFLHQQPHRKATNANYTYKNQRWKLTAEKPGTEIDTIALFKSFQVLLAAKDTLLDLRNGYLYQAPKYTKESKELKNAKKTLDKAMKSKILLTHEKGNFELDKELFAPWLSLDKDLKVKVNYLAAQYYVQQIAARIELPLSEILTLIEKNPNDDTLKNPTFMRMDIFKEVDFVMNAIINGKMIEHPIVFVTQGLPRGLQEGLKDFVEVSILDQKLWLFREGQLLLETNVVTGNKRLNRDTPTGHFHINVKTKDRVLRGPGYESFVKYWMPFYKGYGLHDAMWRSRFGADIYQNGGSHGCVNIPPKKAPLVYDNVEVGMDVIIR
jgi:hypothetical protein